MTPRSGILILFVSAIPQKPPFFGCLQGNGLRTISAKQSSILVRAKHMRLAQFGGSGTGSSQKWARMGRRDLSSSPAPLAFVRARNGRIQSLRCFMESILPPSGYLVRALLGMCEGSILMTIALILLYWMIFSPTKMELLLNKGKKSRTSSWGHLRAPLL